MQSFVSAIIAFAAAHSLLAYGLAFLLAAAEAFPVVGGVVPGTAVIIGLGALVPGGALAMWPLVGATAAGAVMGDGLSYLFGRRYKQRAVGLWPLWVRPGLLASGEAFFVCHGGKAVLIARFMPADRAVFHFLQSLRLPVVDQVMVAITELGDASVIVPVTVAVLAWLAWQRAWRATLYGVASVVGASAFALLLKVTLHHSRPGALYDGWNAYSFPSSHAAVSTALFGFLVVLLCREVGARARVAVTLAAVSLVSAIAFSRLYLGAHWLSDVVAGLAFGTAWAALLGIVYLQHAGCSVRAGGVAGISLAALLAAGSLHIVMAHADDMRRYAVRQPVESMALTAWQDGGWAALPVRRVDLSGDYEEPFTIQWAGPLANLKSALLARAGAVGSTLVAAMAFAQCRANHSAGLAASR
ncbi:MAG TPA: phosphatase PAP2 family protein [Acidocella sp.]|nr:phosphatase PAP2 family protein [Acidocella sp.]